MAEQTALVAVPEDVMAQLPRIVQQAQGVTIENVEDYEGTTAFLKLIDERLALFDQLFDENIRRWHAGHKAAVAQKAGIVGPFSRAAEIIKYKRIEFRSKAERDRQQKERELREVAEAQQKADLEAQAKTLEKAGDPTGAEAVREFAEAAPAPVVVLSNPVPKAGTRVTKHWKFRVIDAALIPRQYLMPDEKAIGAHGRSLGEKALIPGVEFYADESEAVL